MNIFYSDETLFVDLYGSVEMNKVKNIVFSILDEYSISNIEINVGEVFEYKSGTIRELKSDYNRMYKGNIKIIKWPRYT